MKPDLVRMKRIALGLLVAAGALYLVAVLLISHHPVWSYVAAFAEAAMVGAIADWFAVVALFRHPLGLPIPHTAIIPLRKDRIGENLAAFVCVNFLSTPQVLARLKAFGPGTRLASWLANPRHAEQAAAHVGAMLGYALQAFDDERVREFFRHTVLQGLHRLDAAHVVGQMLSVMTADLRHQALLDAVLRKLAQLLDDEALKARIAEVVAAEVRLLRIVGLEQAAGRYVTSRIVASLVRLVGEMAGDPSHPLRLEFDAFMTKTAARLQHDPHLRAQAAELQRELLDSPALGGYLHQVWRDAVDAARADLMQPDSVLRARLAAAIERVGEQLLADAPMQRWIDEQLERAAPAWIERYRESIRVYIVARVNEWNAVEMTRELEHNIGRDLQFIRINGTLVGGLVGLAIHAATAWWHAIGV